MREEWLMPGAVVPVDAETTADLVGEIKRMMHIIGGMALNQRCPWVSLTDQEVWSAIEDVLEGGGWLDVARVLEQALKEKNT